jgi:hypothetical protein
MLEDEVIVVNALMRVMMKTAQLIFHSDGPFEVGLQKP